MARRKRPPAGSKETVYLVTTGVARHSFLLTEECRDKFILLLLEYAFHCDIELMDFEIQDNHLHIYFKARIRLDIPTDEELILRMEVLTGRAGDKHYREKMEKFRAAGDLQEVERLRKVMLGRLGNTSYFIGVLKQRFSRWYNLKHDSQGAFWEGRFHSLMVEGGYQGSGAAGFYVAMNAVAAGIVGRPEDYKWSGFARAAAGDPVALRGIKIAAALILQVSPEQLDDQEAFSIYRTLLYIYGEENRGFDQDGKPLRKGISPERVAEVLAQHKTAQLTNLTNLLPDRVVTHGVSLGGISYNEEVFGGCRWAFSSVRRTGSRRVHGIKATLYCLRNLAGRDSKVAKGCPTNRSRTNLSTEPNVQVDSRTPS